jgi:HPt (histidine-containing phosphotransfer) domain-containing protein
MADLVQLFLGELPSRISALQDAWRERRVQNVSRIAHQLKGACAGYGFPALGSAAGTLEASLHHAGERSAEAALDKAGTQLKELIELCARACRSAA